jgi:hypothetical protein
MLVNGLGRIGHHVLHVAHKLLLLEKLLGIVRFITDALIPDAVYKRLALGPIYGFAHKFDEGLRIALEVGQSVRFAQNFNDAPTGQLGSILKVGNDIWQDDVALLDRHDRTAVLVAFFSFNATLSDG